MKRRLFTFALAALTIGLLGSCSKINERIDDLDKRVYDLENNKIASVDQQITAINVSINDLKAADVTINGKIDELKATAQAHQTLIDALKEADKALEQKDTELEGRIATLEGQVATINGQIATLEDADKAINIRIDELQSYVDTEIGKTKDWAEETFATLEQYQQTADNLATLSVTVTGISTTLTGVQTSITGLDTKINGIDAALQGKITAAKTELEGKITSLKTELEDKIASAISASETSIKAWINELLEGYYTAAQVDEKIDALSTALETSKSTAKTRIDSLATELTKTKAAVDTAKANIRTEYKNAIDVAINTLDGEIRGALLESIAAVNARIEALDTRVTTLEGKVLALEGKVDKLFEMVQSVTIVPAYSDGSVESTKDGVLYLDIIVSPAQAVATLTKDSLKVLVNEVKTRAVDVDTVAVTKFKVDAAKGTITARADISSNLPVASGKALTIAVNVKNGISDYTTEFYPVYFSTESNVTVTDEGSTTKVTIKADENFPESSAGNIVVAAGFKDSKPTTVDIKVGGSGTVIFDAKATSQIKANAEQAGATNVFFKVEDVTTTKPVKNADVVLEVTMKTVDKNGKEVFNEKNAAGEVTIQIPMDENVAYVNSVTLVNDAGEHIEGGVVPGSEEIENGTLTFKVNHFSKYAVDYVTTAEYKAVTGVILDLTSATLEVGDTYRLAATIAPEDATNKKVTWSSSDTTKVKVDDTGKITAVAFGKATITVTTKDGNMTATCEVKVSETKTMADILKTTTGIPESQNLTPPANAWVNSTNTGCKAFIGVDAEGDKLFVILKEGQGAAHLGLCMDDVLARIDDNTYQRIEPRVGTFTIKMAEGKFTSYEFAAVSGSAYEQFNGTYSAPAAPTEYTVTFDLNGISGTAPEAQKIEENSKVTKPTDPTDTVHTFAGWYKTKDATTGALSDPWDFDNGTVTADMTLYAKWTRTLGSIYGTNENVPRSENNTAPNNAWENDDGEKAFIGYSGKTSEILCLRRKDGSSGTYMISCKKTENFTKIGDDYVFSYGTQYGVFTLHMTEGKFTSVTYDGTGTTYEELNGTYAAPEVILPAGALKGGFSVSATKTVYFSKGNMYWDGDSFEFEANQYDSQSSWNTSHVSHFFWSKNASVAYANEYSESGTTTTDVFFTNEEQETAKAGFTVNGVAGKYRTLSMDEWIYLGTKRTMTNGGSRYENLTSSGITIEGVTFNGIVLFPDDFTDQETWKTKYTTWEALNSAGLVFLPAAGYRSGSEFTTVDAVGESGDYWSSTPDSSPTQAKVEHFFSKAFNVGYTSRNKGCCIRLVTEGD